MTSDRRDGSVFSVPEPPSGMGSGFLTEYWRSNEPLPRIRGAEVAWYYVSQGVRTVTALPMSSVITVMTIAVSIFMLAGFMLILQNVNNLLSQAGGTLYVTAYLHADAELEAVEGLVGELEANPRVRSVTYTSKERALELFRQQLGSKAAFVAGLERENPLPASLDLVLRPDELINATPAEFVDELKRSRLVDEVVYGSEWVEQMRGVLQLFRAFGTGTLLIALAIIAFLISNTIKLVIYARRNEVAIMQLVGASDSFIKIPFVIGGLLQGFLGSFVGLGVLKVAYLLVAMELSDSLLFGVSLPEIQFLHTWAVLLIGFLGLLVGAVGSFFALGRFMNV